MTPDFTHLPPSWAQGSLVFSFLNPGRGPSPGQPASLGLALLKRYPHARIACDLHPSSPASSKIPTPQHTHILIPGRGWLPGRRPPEVLNFSGGQGPGPCPCLSQEFPHFPQHCFSPSPPAPQPERKLHNPLGAANVAITHSTQGTTRPEGLSHPQVYPTQTDS